MTDLMRDFLSSTSTFSLYEAEYTILSGLFFNSEFCSKSFLLVMDEISDVSKYKSEIQNAISNNFRRDSMNIFILEEGKVSDEHEESGCNSSEFKNKASQNYENKYVYCQTNNGVDLYKDGEIDDDFSEFFDERKRIDKENSTKSDLNKLPEVLKRYQVLRKIDRKTTFFRGDKIDSSLFEQDFRNDLNDFLEKNMKGRVTFEENTSKMADEESVDLAISDKNHNISIIEVKFIVKSCYFDGIVPGKEGYSFFRFRDGYEQLNRYCQTLAADSRKIYQSYLYMFYAHDKVDQIKEKSKNYLEKLSDVCPAFINSYSGTVLDNLLENFDHIIQKHKISQCMRNEGNGIDSCH